MNQREYRTLILAGLLHDVGKLLIKDPDERERAREATRAAGGKGAAHWVLGDDFLRRSGLAETCARSGVDVDFEALCFAVRWHHHYREGAAARDAVAGLGARADDYVRIRDCIAEGDGLSAAERPDPDPELDYSLALQSIYANLDLELGRGRGRTELRYLPRLLTPEAAFPGDFPIGNKKEAREFREDAYRPLVLEFKAAFAAAVAEAHTFAELETAVYALLERYGWAIPSDMNARAEPRDVSLFDHERTTCALAAAVYLWRLLAPEAEKKHPRFLLIKGDLSGIQDYIYAAANVGPGGVAKRLRARSFFVTALVEAAAHRLREKIVPGAALPIAAQIMSGGGQFVLLAPDLPAVADNLATIGRQVNDWLWRTLQGDLALVLGTAHAESSDLEGTKGRSIADVLAELERSTAEAKRHRLGDLLQATDDEGQAAWDPGAFVWDYLTYEPHGTCPGCGRLPAQAGQGAAVDRQLCPRCYHDRVLAEQIVGARRRRGAGAEKAPPGARYVAYFHGPQPPQPRPGLSGDDRDVVRLKKSTLALFGPEDAAERYVVLLASRHDLDDLQDKPYQLDGLGYEPGEPALVRHLAGYVPRWPDEAKLADFCTAGRCCVEGSYTGPNACGILDRADGEPAGPDDYPLVRTFGCISAAAAEAADGALGSQLLGVLRADVDRLGRLFRDGLGEARSLSRVATLSRMTDLFFSGWVHHTLAHPPDGHRFGLLYTVYSGGDDLCLVGPWDVVIDFARHLAEQFEAYVAGNPNVTLSAAIAVTKPKFPIATSARQAGRWLEERAKGEGRNRLHLFGVTARWRDVPDALAPAGLGGEALRVADLWPWAGLLDEELGRWRAARPVRYPVSAAFAHRLLDYAERAREWTEQKRISAEDMLYMARLAYDLGRNVIKSDAVPAATKSELSRLTQLNNREVMAAMRLPITYALYRNRERSHER